MVKKVQFAADEQQRKNLFDLAVGVVVSFIVILTFLFNKPQQTTQPTVNSQQSTAECH